MSSTSFLPTRRRNSCFLHRCDGSSSIGTRGGGRTRDGSGSGSGRGSGVVAVVVVVVVVYVVGVL